jgi:hypothetical protein
MLNSTITLSTPEQRLANALRRLKIWRYVWLAFTGVLVLIVFCPWDSKVDSKQSIAPLECTLRCNLGNLVQATYTNQLTPNTELHTDRFVVLLRGAHPVELNQILEIRSNASEPMVCVLGTNKCWALY